MLVASKTVKSFAKSLAGRPVPIGRGSPQPIHPPAEPIRPLTDCRFLAVIPTAWGVCGAVWKNHEDEIGIKNAFAARPSGALLCKLTLPGLTVGALRQMLLHGHSECHEVFGDGRGHFHPEVVPEWFPQLVSYMQGYYANCLRDWTLAELMGSWNFWQPRLDWSQLTEFQRQVLEATAAIGRGHRMTYGQLAKQIGRPKASRAVGAALGANPWPMLIPCHRVIGSGGRMTGFSAPGGVAAKRRMLAIEAESPVGEGGLFH